MITSHQVWEAVKNRAPGPRKEKIEKLRKFLDRLDNPHAQVLSDRVPHAECDQASATSLEAWLVGEHLASKIDKFHIAEWLRLCFDAIKEFNDHGHNLFPTRLADIARPESSPFSPASVDQQRFVDPWRQALYRWITDEEEKASEDWLAAIAMSAVMHGALLDATRLSHFLAMLQRNELPVYEQGGSCVLFNLPYQGLGNHNLQRWFIDPLTEMLVWRYVHVKNKPTGLKPEFLIKTFLARRIKQDFVPTSLGDFLSRSVTWWSMRASLIDIHCATRGVVTHSVNDRSWARIHNYPYASHLEESVSQKNDDGPLDSEFDTDDIMLLHPWLQESIQALNLPTKQQARQAIDTLRNSESDKGTASLFLHWLIDLLDGLSATKVELKISTITQRYQITAPRLLAILGEDDVRQMDIHNLEDIYADLMSDPDPLIPRSVLANGIRDFHSFLNRHHKKPFITKESEVLGERHSLKPVDASILTFDEYFSAQDWLDKAPVNVRDKKSSKIILALAFKLGARRMEIFGLLLSDLQLVYRPTLLIQKNSKRRIKTNSSRRVMPLLAFLGKAELTLLTEWIEIYRNPSAKLEGSPDHDPYFFHGFTGDPDQYWTKKITDLAVSAIRAVTNDRQLYLHHLRHSFASWTYLRLRAPDFPNIHKHFEECPATVFALKTGKRLRVLLYNRDPGVSRTYAFAVSRLLGHSSPISSFGHYIHSSDLVLGAITARETARMPIGILLAASGLQKSAAYENYGKSLAQLLIASRMQHIAAGAIREKNVVPVRTRGRPRSPSVHESAQWIPLVLADQILASSITDRKVSSAIAKEFDVREDFVTTLISKATDYGRQIGLKTGSDGSISEIPLRVHKQEAGRNYCNELERRLAEMSTRAPLLYAEGIKLYLSHYDHEKKDVVFRGEKDLPAARRLLKFLSSLGCKEDEFCWVIRTIDFSTSTLPPWAKSLEKLWTPKTFKAIKPKKASSAGSYAKWLGILPVLGNSTSVGLPVAHTIFLASLTIPKAD